MVQLVLNEEQIQQLGQSSGRVELVDPRGRVVADFYLGFTEDEIQRAGEVRDSIQPTSTTAKTLEYLRNLE